MSAFDRNDSLVTDASLRTTPRPTSCPNPQALTHQAIDHLSAALLELQLAMRQLPEVHPAMETLRYATSQLTGVGEALYGVRETLDA